MQNEQDTHRILELATAIVLKAMDIGRLDAGNAEAVANYYDVISAQMMRSALIDLPDIAERKMKKHVVNP